MIGKSAGILFSDILQAIELYKQKYSVQNKKLNYPCNRLQMPTALWDVKDQFQYCWQCDGVPYTAWIKRV